MQKNIIVAEYFEHIMTKLCLWSILPAIVNFLNALVIIKCNMFTPGLRFLSIVSFLWPIIDTIIIINARCIFNYSSPGIHSVICFLASEIDYIWYYQLHDKKKRHNFWTINSNYSNSIQPLKTKPIIVYH